MGFCCGQVVPLLMEWQRPGWCDRGSAVYVVRPLRHICVGRSFWLVFRVMIAYVKAMCICAAWLG